MPGLWARSPVGALKRQPHIDVSLPLSLHSPLSKNKKINLKKKKPQNPNLNLHKKATTTTTTTPTTTKGYNQGKRREMELDYKVKLGLNPTLCISSKSINFFNVWVGERP